VTEMNTKMNTITTLIMRHIINDHPETIPRGPESVFDCDFDQLTRFDYFIRVRKRSMVLGTKLSLINMVRTYGFAARGGTHSSFRKLVQYLALSSAFAINCQLRFGEFGESVISSPAAH
jgi:hypothetical protein